MKRIKLIKKKVVPPKRTDIKVPTGTLLKYFKKYKHDFFEWYPTSSKNWLPLISKFGAETPAREFCHTEVFMSDLEKVESKKAYLAAFDFYIANKGRDKDSNYYRARLNIERIFDQVVSL